MNELMVPYVLIGIIVVALVLMRLWGRPISSHEGFAFHAYFNVFGWCAEVTL